MAANNPNKDNLSEFKGNYTIGGVARTSFSLDYDDGAYSPLFYETSGFELENEHTAATGAAALGYLENGADIENGAGTNRLVPIAKIHADWRAVAALTETKEGSDFIFRGQRKADGTVNVPYYKTGVSLQDLYQPRGYAPGNSYRVVYTPGTAAIAGSFDNALFGTAERKVMVITIACAVSGNVTVTLNSVAYTVALTYTGGETTTTTAAQFATQSYSTGGVQEWVATSIGASVYFTALSYGNKAGNFAFNAGITGTSEHMLYSNCESASSPTIDTSATTPVRATWARSNVQAHGGTYSWLLTKLSATGAGDAYVVLNHNSFDTADLHGLVRGTRYTLSVWCYNTGATAGNVSIALREYYSSTWYEIITLTSTVLNQWELLTGVATINASATGIILAPIILSAEAVNTKVYLDDFTLTAGPVSVYEGATGTLGHRIYFFNALIVGGGGNGATGGLYAGGNGGGAGAYCIGGFTFPTTVGTTNKFCDVSYGVGTDEETSSLSWNIPAIGSGSMSCTGGGVAAAATPGIVEDLWASRDKLTMTIASKANHNGTLLFTFSNTDGSTTDYDVVVTSAAQTSAALVASKIVADAATNGMTADGWTVTTVGALLTFIANPTMGPRGNHTFDLDHITTDVTVTGGASEGTFGDTGTTITVGTYICGLLWKTSSSGGAGGAGGAGDGSLNSGKAGSAGTTISNPGTIISNMVGTESFVTGTAQYNPQAVVGGAGGALGGPYGNYGGGGGGGSTVSVNTVGSGAITAGVGGDAGFAGGIPTVVFSGSGGGGGGGGGLAGGAGGKGILVIWY